MHSRLCMYFISVGKAGQLFMLERCSVVIGFALLG